MKFPKKTSLIFIFSGFFLIAISFYDTELISVNADEFYPAPEYQAITLDNEVVSLTDYKGKVILVNLWATWCEPCRDEMPLLEDLSQTFSLSKQMVLVQEKLNNIEENIQKFSKKKPKKKKKN